VKLYSYWHSSAAFRVRIALNLKGLSAEYMPVDLNLEKRENLQSGYLSVNPEGRIPALVTDDGLLGQSMAILEWLEEMHPDPSLFPSDAWQKARCRAFANTIACDIHPLANIGVLGELKSRFGADLDAITDWHNSWIARGFRFLEKQAAERQTKFLFADYPTLAEICLIPQMKNGHRMKLDFSEFPTLIEIETRCYELDAFDAARPENQPDAPKST